MMFEVGQLIYYHNDSPDTRIRQQPYYGIVVDVTGDIQGHGYQEGEHIKVWWFEENEIGGWLDIGLIGQYLTKIS